MPEEGDEWSHHQQVELQPPRAVPGQSAWTHHRGLQHHGEEIERTDGECGDHPAGLRIPEIVAKDERRAGGDQGCQDD